MSYEEANNNAGASGAKKVRVWLDTDFVFTLTGITSKDTGKAVYATVDDAIALAGQPDAYVGRVVHKHAAHQAVIRLKQPGGVHPVLGGMGKRPRSLAALVNHLPDPDEFASDAQRSSLPVLPANESPARARIAGKHYLLFEVSLESILAHATRIPR